MRDNVFVMKRFVYIILLAAFLSVWIAGAGAYVSDPWRSDSVMSVRDFQQIDLELGSQKTLVPGLESQWIICRNDPVNMIDPDGRKVEPALARLGDQIIQFAARIEAANGSQMDPFATLQTICTEYGANYYLEAPGVGELSAIDLKHFLHTALWASVFHQSAFGRLAGHANEYRQRRTSSFYSPEDVPSNNLGSLFGADLASGIPLSVQLKTFFQMLGINMNDEAELEGWKNYIQAYNDANPVQSGYNEEDESTYTRSFGYGAQNAANESMWGPKDHPDGYAGN